jgi:amino acid transporter
VFTELKHIMAISRATVFCLLITIIIYVTYVFYLPGFGDFPDLIGSTHAGALPAGDPARPISPAFFNATFVSIGPTISKNMHVAVMVVITEAAIFSACGQGGHPCI